MSKPRKSTRIEKRRRLKELYAKGYDVVFNEHGSAVFDSAGKKIIGSDDFERTDEDICVFVTPPSPLERDQAIREANAVRARATLKARQELDSAESVNSRAYVTGMSYDTLLDYVLMIDEVDRQRKAEREVNARDEWEDLDDLRDAMRQWEEAGQPATEEWDPLLKRDVEYGRQIDEVADRIRAEDREGLALLPREELERRAIDKRLDMVGTQAFMSEYERQMLYASCKDGDNRDEPMFESVDELYSYPEEIVDTLQKTLARFITEAAEAKNSQRAESGSE